MSWFIQDGVNNGYPALDVWLPTWTTGWTSDGNIRLPDYTWRIKAGVNGGYPWIYWWFREDTPTGGEMIIGGSQSNYPNGFTSANRGGIKDDFDNQSMLGGGNAGGGLANTVLSNALANRAFVIGSSTLTAMLATFNNTTIFDDTERAFISSMYGANVFDSIISCKIFPFDLGNLMFIGGYGGQSVISSTTGDIKAFGRYTLAQNANLLASVFGYYNFPTITVTPTQAWEIENIDFSIYLPMAGLYPIDIRGVCDIDIQLMVDLIDGTGEYYVYIDGQLMASYRAMLAADVPVNNNQGRMQANMLTNVVSSFGKAAATLTGAAMGGIGGSFVGQTIGGLLPTEHYAMNTPAVGGIASMQCYSFPRIVAKIPKMFKDGYGFFETLGANRSTTYVRLSECSGYVQCENYKTDIIVATDTEKAEIEKLMNAGVFL